MIHVRSPLRLQLAGAVLLGGLLTPAAPLLAQTAPVVSHPVVQSLPVGAGGEGMKLNDALGRLAQNPRDVDSLLDAGRAALDLGDIDAAIGFYDRAGTLAPGNARAKVGLAGAYVLRGDPFTAIALFREAEQSGQVIEPARLADRGLAYDMVGDNLQAQQYYREALMLAPTDETARRLALSQAISGDRRAMELTLSPLLQKQDKAGWRTRAFGLAALGYIDEAEAIARQSLPADKANAMSAYLRYMPRLTAAQQAAAGNLGRFPRAAEIGTDDPRVAQFARPRPVQVAAATPAASLADKTRTKGRAKPRAAAAAISPPPQVTSSAAPAALPPGEPQVSKEAVGTALAAAPAGELPPIASAGNNAPAKLPAAAPVATLAPASAPSPTPVPSSASSPTPVPGFVSLDPSLAQSASVAAVTANPAPGFDLAKASPPSLPPAEAAPPPVPLSAKTASLAEVFADFTAPSRETEPQAGAVDLRKLATVRAAQAKDTASIEVAVKDAPTKDAKTKDAKAKTDLDLCEEVKPAKGKSTAKGAAKSKAAGKNSAKAAATQCKLGKDGKVIKTPSQPSRIWVQVATGRNKKALAYDWRRFLKEEAEVFKGRKGYTSPWGATNRLLTGPFDTETAAKQYIVRLKKAGVDDAFTWISPAGQVVDVLP